MFEQPDGAVGTHMFRCDRESTIFVDLVVEPACPNEASRAIPSGISKEPFVVTYLLFLSFVRAAHLLPSVAVSAAAAILTDVNGV